MGKMALAAGILAVAAGSGLLWGGEGARASPPAAAGAAVTPAAGSSCCCRRCAERLVVTEAGTCSACGGTSASTANALCERCASRLHRCLGCGRPLAGASAASSTAGPAPAGSGPPATPGAESPPIAEGDFAWGEPANGLRLGLRLERTALGRGEPVGLAVAVRNDGAGPLEVPAELARRDPLGGIWQIRFSPPQGDALLAQGYLSGEALAVPPGQAREIRGEIPTAGSGGGARDARPDLAGGPPAPGGAEEPARRIAAPAFALDSLPAGRWLVTVSFTRRENPRRDAQGPLWLGEAYSGAVELTVTEGPGARTPRIRCLVLETWPGENPPRARLTAGRAAGLAAQARYDLCRAVLRPVSAEERNRRDAREGQYDYQLVASITVLEAQEGSALVASLRRTGLPVAAPLTPEPVAWARAGEWVELLPFGTVRSPLLGPEVRTPRAFLGPLSGIVAAGGEATLNLHLISCLEVVSVEAFPLNHSLRLDCRVGEIRAVLEQSDRPVGRNEPSRQLRATAGALEPGEYRLRSPVALRWTASPAVEYSDDGASAPPRAAAPARPAEATPGFGTVTRAPGARAISAVASPQALANLRPGQRGVFLLGGGRYGLTAELRLIEFREGMAVNGIAPLRDLVRGEVTVALEGSISAVQDARFQITPGRFMSCLE